MDNTFSKQFFQSCFHFFNFPFFKFIFSAFFKLVFNISLTLFKFVWTVFIIFPTYFWPPPFVWFFLLQLLFEYFFKVAVHMQKGRPSQVPYHHKMTQPCVLAVLLEKKLLMPKSVKKQLKTLDISIIISIIIITVNILYNAVKKQNIRKFPFLKKS